MLGEARFHTCLEAEAAGIGLLLPGHFASERFAVECLAEVLGQAVCRCRGLAQPAGKRPDTVGVRKERRKGEWGRRKRRLKHPVPRFFDRLLPFPSPFRLPPSPFPPSPFLCRVEWWYALRTLTALPVYNEVDHVAAAVAGALSYCPEVLVVDDGSTDGTSAVAGRPRRHSPDPPPDESRLRGGAPFGVRFCHPRRIRHPGDDRLRRPAPAAVDSQVHCARVAEDDADIVSGSRYLRRFPGDSDPPEQRRRINQIITEEVNRRLGLRLTDAFCGFKAYSVPALAKIELTETGYAMPLELWVRAVQLGLRIVELPVPRSISTKNVRSAGHSTMPTPGWPCIGRCWIGRSRQGSAVAERDRHAINAESRTWAALFTMDCT